MFVERSRTVRLSAWTLAFIAGCGTSARLVPCMESRGTSALVSGAAALRVDVYGGGAHCDGASITAGSMPDSTNLFRPDQQIRFQVPPGHHAVALSTYADAEATMLTGRGCQEGDFSSGAQVCLDLTVAPASDGGQPDGAMPDAGTGCGSLGAATQCAAGALLCDGFETSSGTTFPNWQGPHLVNYNGGAANPGTFVSVGHGPICGGTNTLHAHAVGLHQQAYLTHTFSNRPNPIYVRMFLNLPSASATVPVTFLGFVNSVGPNKWWMLELEPAGASGFDYTGNVTSVNPQFPTATPLDEWICVETMVRFDPTNGEVRVMLNGTVVGDMQGLTTEPAGTVLDSIQVGMASIDLPGSQTADLYVDDVVVSASPIGCN